MAIQLQAAQFRFARPTQQLEKIVHFYTKGLGLQVIGSFKNHAGYDGVMLGLPDADYHLEFTQDVHGTAGTASNPEHLMVFYFSDEINRIAIYNQLIELGHLPVKPANPYWENNSFTFCDPDGWHIVLHNGIYK